MLVTGGRIHAFIEYERDGHKVCFAKVFLGFARPLCDAFQRERKGVPRDASPEVVSEYTVLAELSDDKWSPYAVCWDRAGRYIVPERFWNATWLSTEEFKTHLAESWHPAEYDAAVRVMEMLPNARLVLWFEPLR